MFYNIDLDKESSIPLYNQLADKIKDMILSGVLPAGSYIPAQRKIAEMLNISRNTVVAAIEKLAEDKFITTHKNSKTIVNKINLKTAENIDWEKQFKVGVIKINERRRFIQASLEEVSPNIPNISIASLGEEFCLMKNINTDIIKSAAIQYHQKRHFNKLGNHPLREAVRDYVKKHNIKCEIDNIVIFSSVIQALNALAFLFLNLGTNFIYEEPNKLLSETLFSSTHTNLIGIPMDNDGIDIKKLQKHIGSRNSRLYLNQTNHNPTGKTATFERRKEILEISKNAGAPIIEVESMRDLWLEREYPIPLKAFPDSDNVIHIGSIVRNIADNYVVAWVIADSPVINELSNIKMLMDAYPSTYHQEVIFQLLISGEYERYLNTVRSMLLKRKQDAGDILKHYLKNYASWNEADSDIYVWLEFEKDINIKTIFEKSKKIIFYPGYYFQKNDLNHISICPASVDLTTFEKSIKYLTSLF